MDFMKMTSKQAPHRQDVQALLLVPRPQKMEILSGFHKPAADESVWLCDPMPSSLRATGQAVRQSLAGIGIRYTICASWTLDSPPAALISIDPVIATKPQGYRLEIAPGQIRIIAHDPAGAWYAAMTLRQIARQCGKAGLPCLRIEDWPDFPQRGIMLDISRDRVPTLATLLRLVEMMSEWKLNVLQLYMEHSFAYRNHKDVWKKSSPLTAQDVLELDAWCRRLHIELVPNQNSFGHMERWLKHPAYQSLAECPEGFETKEHGHLEPRSLCPTDRGAIDLIAGLYEELLPNFTSRQINVGCDETMEIGMGRSRFACTELGRGRVFLNHALRLHRLAGRHGRTMQIWSDIILEHPEIIADIPRDIVPLVYGYEADEDFKGKCAPFRKQGFTFHICPGTSSWNSIAGRTRNALANIRKAAECGVDAGASGFLITDWGDCGHWQHLSISYAGFLYGAAVAWSVRPNAEIDLPAALDAHVFGAPNSGLGSVAHDLGNAHLKTGVVTGNATILFKILLAAQSQPGSLLFGKPPLSDVKPEGLRHARSEILRLQKRLKLVQPAGSEACQAAAELAQAADLLVFSCDLGLMHLKECSDGRMRIDDSTRQHLSQRLKEIFAGQRRLWLARNRPGGLDDSMARFAKILEWLDTKTVSRRRGNP